MTEKRKCVVYEYKIIKVGGQVEKVCVGHGLFLALGINYEEFKSGPGMYTTAIVEMPDGSVMNVPVETIVFNN